MKPFQRLQRHWLDTGANVRITALGENRVGALEQKYGVILPGDFREYLLQSCPLNGEMDSDTTSWWPVDRIKNIPEEYEHEIKNPTVAGNASTYLFFADYAIWCWAWAIACGDDENRGKVVVINGVSDHFVAGSFGEFIDRYVNDRVGIE